MARLPCFFLPGIPNHITQRGNRRERTFFEDAFTLICSLMGPSAPEWQADKEERTGRVLAAQTRGPKLMVRPVT